MTWITLPERYRAKDSERVLQQSGGGSVPRECRGRIRALSALRVLFSETRLDFKKIFKKKKKIWRPCLRKESIVSGY